ncbi:MULTISPECIES: cytochrome c oxidase subunit 2A [Bacillaceae]|nr:cytochrome c oxidase subunit 2A [Bacillus sp. S3]QCJ41516.1 cytochrome c oxidase subunit 2A [Bacillus sp. S3]
MAATKGNKKNEAHEAPLKGTWISVGVVGVVILLTYLLLYGLFMTRL